MGVDGQLHVPAALRPVERPVPTVQEVGWAPCSVWTGAKKLPPGFDPRTVQLYIGYAISAPAFFLERV